MTETGPTERVQLTTKGIAYGQWRAYVDDDDLDPLATFSAGWDAAHDAAHDAAEWQQAEAWHSGYDAGRDSRWNGLFRRLTWLPEPAYYWLLDRLTDNDGWRPLSYREANR